MYSGRVTATVSIHGTQLAVLNRYVSVGSRPDARFISSLQNRTTVGSALFTDAITYRGVAVRVNNPHGIFAGDWLPVSGGGITVRRMYDNLHAERILAGLIAGSLGTNSVQVRLQNHCGASDLVTLTYTRLGGGGPIIGNCPCDCTCCEVSPCHQCGGFDNCPFCPCFSSGGFLAFPNPVDNILTIDLTQVETSEAFGARTRSLSGVEVPARTNEVFYIRLFNAHGVVVRQQRTQARTIQFDVSNLPEGTYYLHIEHGGEIEKHQIIVQRN